MGLFDKLKKGNTQNTQESSFDKSVKEVTIVIANLPESADELKALPEATLDTPFKTAALTVCALCAYAADAGIGGEMLEFLRGPGGPLSPLDKSFLKDRFMDGKHYIPFSYFSGAVPANDYTPNEPYTLKVSSNPYSYQDDGYATLYIASGGADSPRPVTLRQKGNQWFVTNYQGLLAGIRTPKSDDAWA